MRFRINFLCFIEEDRRPLVGLEVFHLVDLDLVHRLVVGLCRLDGLEVDLNLVEVLFSLVVDHLVLVGLYLVVVRLNLAVALFLLEVVHPILLLLLLASTPYFNFSFVPLITVHLLSTLPQAHHLLLC